MTTKHTAGPWKLSDSNRMDMHIRAGEKGFVIAEVNSRTANFIGNQSEAEANAQLIAAAPELLVALEIVYIACNVGEVNKMYGRNPNHWTNVVINAIKTAVKQ